MDEVLQANVFFVIASVATVAFFVLISLILYQVYKIITIIRSVVERVEAASEVVAQDMADVRTSIKKGGIIGKIVSFIIGAVSAKKARNKRSRD